LETWEVSSWLVWEARVVLHGNCRDDRALRGEQFERCPFEKWSGSGMVAVPPRMASTIVSVEARWKKMLTTRAKDNRETFLVFEQW